VVYSRHKAAQHRNDENRCEQPRQLEAAATSGSKQRARQTVLHGAE
jgi:hypothetical protein